MRRAAWRNDWRTYVTSALLVFALVLYVLHFFHLRADFPNHSPWMDWAKYTDEGWYGDAAIRYYLRGTWHLPGDFNPGAALPVWPFLEALVFRFTGVGIVAARALAVAVFGGNLICAYLLLRSRVPGLDLNEGTRRLFAASAVALLAASSFLYAFSRMAILEPLLVFWLLLALLLARSIREGLTGWPRVVRLAAVGLLVALMIGTKTTAIFLLPSVAWMLWSASGWHFQQMARETAITASAAIVPGLLYLVLLLRGGLLQDVRYLFSANAYTAISAENFWTVVWQTLADGAWIGLVLYWSSIGAVFVASCNRRTLRDSVFMSLVLWAAGYIAYIAYHANFQPRYYLVVAVPLVLLLARSALHISASSPVSLYAFAPLLVALLAKETVSTWRYVKNPEYTYQLAAERIERIVSSEPQHSHTVLSISGSNLSLMTGVPSICDDFGTMDLQDRIAAYRPGWFVTWNYVEDDKMQALARFYQLTRVASFPAMDDPERNLMIIYRLDAKAGAEPKRRTPRSRQKTQPAGSSSI